MKFSKLSSVPLSWNTDIYNNILSKRQKKTRERKEGNACRPHSSRTALIESYLKKESSLFFCYIFNKEHKPEPKCHPDISSLFNLF